MVIGRNTTSAKVALEEKKLNTAIIPFNSAELVTAKDENGKIYVAMKPIAETIGLSWGEQNKKITMDERYSVITIPLQTSGGIQEMTCLPLDQLAGWLYSINPNKVKAEAKQTVIAFQQETFNVINAYWMGKVVSRPQTPKDPMEVMRVMFQAMETHEDRLTILENTKRLEHWQAMRIKDAVSQKVLSMIDGDMDSRKTIYPKIYRLLNNRFNVPRYGEIPAIEFQEALRFVERIRFIDLLTQLKSA